VRKQLREREDNDKKQCSEMQNTIRQLQDKITVLEQQQVAKSTVKNNDQSGSTSMQNQITELTAKCDALEAKFAAVLATSKQQNAEQLEQEQQEQQQIPPTANATASNTSLGDSTLVNDNGLNKAMIQSGYFEHQQ